MDIERAIKNIGDWISRESESRKYPKVELLELSESLQTLNAEIARQSATSEEVAEAIDTLQVIRPSEKEIQSGVYPEVAEAIDIAITALQAYQPWIPVSESIPIERDLQNGMVLAWSTELCEWQVENWGYVEDRPDDYTHWKPLPEPPKGETL